MPSAYISFIVFFLILVFGFAHAPIFSDPDTAWHIATGDLIRFGHTIPRHDSWSFTAQGEVWYNISWLFDGILSFLTEYGGFSAVYLMTILMLAGSIALMVDYALKEKASPACVILLVFPITCVVFTGALARPNLCSILLTVFFYRCLSEFSKNRDIKKLIPLPLLMALWANLHGGFLLAFFLLGLFFIQAWAERDAARIKVYSILTFACFIATFINPYGFAVYYGAFKTLFAPFSEVLIEWKPVAVGHNVPLTVLLLLVIVLGDVFDKRVALADRLLAPIIMILALSSLRHGVIASLLLLPYLAVRATTLLYASAKGEKIRRFDNTLLQDLQKKDARMIASAMVFVACIFIVLPWPRDMILGEPVGFIKKRFPKEEAAYVAEHYPELHFFNSYNIGGYLDYLWRGKVKVFVDGRANSLYSDELLDDYKNFAESRGFGGRAQLIAKQYNLDGLIIDNNDEGIGEWSWNPEWKIVYKGKAATVFLKNE